MNNKRYVIIPTDFSSTAHKAFDYAVHLKGGENHTFLVLNSYYAQKSGGNAVFVNLDEMLAKDSKRELAKEEKTLRENYPDVNIETLSVHGMLDEVINNLDLDGEVECIVMGTTGAGGLKKALIGSNAQKIIYESDYPVFTVPRAYDFKPIKNIVYAADLETIPSAQLFDPVVALAKKFDAHIKVLHVDHSKDSKKNLEREENRLRLKERLEGVDCSFHTMKRYEVAEAIDDFVFDNETDLLTLVPKKMTFLRSLFRTAITKKIVCHAKVPLLALKTKAE